MPEDKGASTLSDSRAAERHEVQGRDRPGAPGQQKKRNTVFSEAEEKAILDYFDEFKEQSVETAIPWVKITNGKKHWYSNFVLPTSLTYTFMN